MANTKARFIRIADETWELAQARAEQEGTNVSAVVRRFLENYAGQPAAVDPAELAKLAKDLQRVARRLR